MALGASCTTRGTNRSLWHPTAAFLLACVAIVSLNQASNPLTLWHLSFDPKPPLGAADNDFVVFSEGGVSVMFLDTHKYPRIGFITSAQRHQEVPHGTLPCLVSLQFVPGSNPLVPDGEMTVYYLHCTCRWRLCTTSATFSAPRCQIMTLQVAVPSKIVPNPCCPVT